MISAIVCQRMRDTRPGYGEPDFLHCVAELLAILGHVDRITRRADQLDTEPLEHPLAHEVERAIEGCLPSHRGQQRVGALFLDDARDGPPVDRLDKDRIRARGIRHDRRWVRVHENDAVPLLLERLASLGSGIIELTRLADDDRSGADDEDAL